MGVAGSPPIRRKRTNPPAMRATEAKVPALTEPNDQVRLLISDVGGESGDDFLFSDNEILTFLSMEGENVYKAAAVALRTIAANEAQVMKRIKILELST